MKGEKFNLADHVVHGALPQFQFALTDEWIEEEMNRRKTFEQLGELPKTITNKFKTAARMGIPMHLRREAWLIASKGKELQDELGDVYENARNIAKRQNKQHTCQALEELFGGSIRLLKYLPESITPIAKEFLEVLWTMNKGIDYSPLIPTIAIILLLFMEPPLAYVTIQAMINRSHDDGWYFAVDRKSYHKSIIAIEKLVQKKVADVAKKAQEFGLNIALITLTLLPAFFLPFMPLPVALTIFDSYIFEGRKVLSRFVITIFKHNREKIAKCTSPEEFSKIILSEMDGLSNPTNLNGFLNECFKMYLTRRKHICDMERISSGEITKMSELNTEAAIITKIFENHIPQDVNPLSFPREDDSNFIQDIASTVTPEEFRKYQAELAKKYIDTSLPEVHGGRILTNSMLYEMREFMPAYYYHQSPELVFSLSKDGTSFSSLSHVKTEKIPHILIIKTAKSIIGAFLSEPPHEQEGSPKYFGAACTFVFQGGETATCYRHSQPPNKNFIFVDKDTLMIGGPNPAILLSNGFETVQSLECDTFGSPVLLQEKIEKVIDIELFMMKTKAR